MDSDPASPEDGQLSLTGLESDDVPAKGWPAIDRTEQALMKSVLKLALIVGLSSAGPAAAAQEMSADSAMERYRTLFKTPKAECERGSVADEVIVCGRRTRDPYRLPLPVEPVPGARVAGEAPDQVEASEVGSERCSTIGPMGGCGSVVPILPFVMWVAKTAVKAIRAAEDE